MFLCVMTSHCIPIDSPSCEELSNFYLKGISLLRQRLLRIFHRYVNSTHVLYFIALFQVVFWLLIWASYDTLFRKGIWYICYMVDGI